VLLVTFHGGGGGGLDNVGAYDDNGNQLTLEVLQGAPRGLLSELRRLALVTSELLWVASGSRHASRIAAFEGSGTSYGYIDTVTEYQSIGSLWHPFDLTLDGAGNCYVSNQDTDVVARLRVTSDMLSASAAPLAPALPADGKFLPGTFVASSDGDLPGVPATSPVEAPAGLAVSFDADCKVANSVRGVAWAQGALYVADEVANVVKVYDGQGAYQGQSNRVTAPVHLLVSPENGGVVLYVSDKSRVLYATLDPAQPANLNLKPVTGIDVPKLSGFAIGTETNFYAGSRHGKAPKIFKYMNFPADPKLETSFEIADEPEFILHVPDAGPATRQPS
jgi:DNA-binding beta-propeller fold protein YncE